MSVKYLEDELDSDAELTWYPPGIVPKYNQDAESALTRQAQSRAHDARILAAARAYADADVAMHTHMVLAVPERLLVDLSTAKRKAERKLIQTIVEARANGWKS